MPRNVFGHPEIGGHQVQQTHGNKLSSTNTEAAEGQRNHHRKAAQRGDLGLVQNSTSLIIHGWVPYTNCLSTPHPPARPRKAPALTRRAIDLELEIMFASWGRGDRFAEVGDGRHFRTFRQVQVRFRRDAAGWLGRPSLPLGISMHSPTFARAQ